MFNPGVYEHVTGFRILVTEDGMIYVTPNTPSVINLQDFLDPTKWTTITDEDEPSEEEPQADEQI